MKLKTKLIAGSVIWGSCLAMFGASLAGGGAVTLSTTPVALSTGSGNPSNKVNSVEIRAVPGYACKAFIGVAGMNTTTLAGVLAVIYPNSSGGWSDRYKIQDPRAGDGIDLSTLYVAGQCGWEATQITVGWYQTGTALASLVPYLYHGSGSSIQLANLIQFRVLPGFVGKETIKSTFGSWVLAVLYPNTGNTSQNNANSEDFEMKDPTGPYLRPVNFTVTPDVVGEFLLVNAWRDSSAP